MAAGSTYTPIATYTATGSQATITFSSISGSYTDLVLIVNATVTSSGYDLGIQLNGDSGSNYSQTILYGTGSAAGSARGANQAKAYVTYYGGIGTVQGNQVIQLMNYSNSTTYKTLITRANRADSGTDAVVNLWRNTAAITSIALNIGGTNFASGSTFTLYGIQAA